MVKVGEFLDLWKGGHIYIVPSNFVYYEEFLESSLSFKQVLLELNILDDANRKAGEKFNKLFKKRKKYYEKSQQNKLKKILNSTIYTIENEPQSFEELRNMEIEGIENMYMGRSASAVFVYVKNCKVKSNRIYI